MNDAQKPTPEQPQSGHWIADISHAINDAGMSNSSKDYCQLRCRTIQRRLTLIYPNRLREENPELLDYLSKFAEKNGLKLLQERRTIPVEPLYECRKEEPPILALGVGILLQQTGLAGSNQLHLSQENPLPQVSGQRFAKLLKIASQVSDNGKRVQLRPNRFLFGEQAPASALTGFASKVIKGQENRVFSYFDNDSFRAIGYMQKSSFIFHVFAGGGPETAPERWGPLSVMTREPIQFRLYRDAQSSKKFGVLYTSYNLDLNQTASKAAYWRKQPQPESRTG
ncbi:MAG: hypothetical protein KDJ38_00385 [Gammaproteobacteria bacterium]|nr:hypothetical protein [Gammaproteobacteria bacterium]